MRESTESRHLAHLKMQDGLRQEQTVAEHARQTGLYVREILRDMGLAETGYLIGILHDVGKCRAAFGAYLEEAVSGGHPGRTNHTFAAATYILQEGETSQQSMEKLACEVLAAAIGMHHGLWDICDPLHPSEEDGFTHREMAAEEIEYEKVMGNFYREVMDAQALHELLTKSLQELTGILDKILQSNQGDSVAKSLSVGYLIRLLASALMEGDCRDTAEFMDESVREENARRKQPDAGFWQEQLAFMEQAIQNLDRSSEINSVRNFVSQQCRDFAKREGGIYRLTVNTGGGKTLASLRYALAHAFYHGKKRIIFVIPLLSVLDQNSKEIRKYLKNPEVVLEHHSNVVQADDDASTLRRDLLTESWDAPVIITTMVQLLQVLFSDRKSAIRRMQALSNSVIVIDEIQSLPLKFTKLFAEQMNFLSECCGTTVILSSATQPAFEKLKGGLHLSPDPDMVILPARMQKVFHRTEVIDRTSPHGMSLDALADFVRAQMVQMDSLLVVCNTRKTARTLYQELNLRRENDWDMYFLSTSMCKKHREDVLASIGSTPGLHGTRKVVCISTQLIEAGIDISFQCVIRALAGIDSIVQAAGRCNRSNEWGQTCPVYVVNLQGEKLQHLREIGEAQACCRQILQRDQGKGQLLTQEAILAYYETLYATTFFERQSTYPVTIEGRPCCLLDLLSLNQNAPISTRRHMLNQAFKTAGENCEVFDTTRTDVICAYDAEAEEAILDLTSAKGLYAGGKDGHISYLRKQIKRLQPYTVSFFDEELAQLRKDQMLDEDRVTGMIFLDRAAYDEKLGVVVDEHDWNR